MRKAHENARQVQARGDVAKKNYYDASHRDITFEIGQTVLVFSPAVKTGLSRKLVPKFSGPFEIVKRTSPVNYTVRNLESGAIENAVHVQHLKGFSVRESQNECKSSFVSESSSSLRPSSSLLADVSDKSKNLSSRWSNDHEREFLIEIDGIQTWISQNQVSVAKRKEYLNRERSRRSRRP